MQRCSRGFIAMSAVPCFDEVELDMISSHGRGRIEKDCYYGMITSYQRACLQLVKVKFGVGTGGQTTNLKSVSSTSVNS